MEDTQILNWEVEEEEEVEERPSESLRCSLEPLGQLRIFSSSYGPEKDFPLYLGKNMIGRMPDCSVALPFSSISKQHAVIEISAWDKAPVLRDCGSLNGTQILRPPKVLGPGMSHRLRDRELILFADLPCQYHRLDVPRPFISRGPLTVEETPRVQGGTQPPRLLLAEDSEEEVDSLLDKCVVKGPRTSSLATVVPESDEEGPSPAPDGPGPPSAFNLNSDTDEEESQESGAGEASSAPRRGTAAETEQPKPVTAEIQIEKDQCSVKERNRDTEIERDVKNGVVPTGVILERSQPSGEDSDTDVSDESGPPRRLAGVRPKRAWSCNFIDSDTDGEDKGIPAAPAVVPMKERQIFHEAGTQSPQAPGVACRQESPADGDTDIEEGEAPLDRSQASMVIDSNTDDEEEVSAALTLARLRESQADSEDLDLPATQCFADRENQSLEAAPSMEDEPTQAFLFTLPQEPGPSCCSSQATGSLNEAWEVLATQPFCPREYEASETQTAVTLLDTRASCPPPSRTAQQEQHPESPVHAEALGMEGRGMQTVEKDMGTQRETAERVIPEGGPPQNETKKLPSEGEREDVTGEEELIGGIQGREQNQVLARDTQSQESDKTVKSASTGRGMEIVKLETETPKETQEKEREKQTLAGEIFESEAGKLVAERESEVGGLEVKGPQELLDRGPQMRETEAGGQDQKVQASGPPSEPGAGAGDLQGFTSDPVASGSQAGGGRGAPGSPRRQQRGK